MRGTVLLLAVFCGVLTVASFTWGQYGVSVSALRDVVRDGLRQVFGIPVLAHPAYDDAARRVVLFIRLPRVLLAGGVGASLAVAGCLFQALFRNPLVSPGLLGASNGAACGAALALLLGLGSSAVSSMALLFGLISIFMVFSLARPVKGDRTLALVLCGLLVSTLFGAALSFMKLVADPNDTLPVITYWLMGALASARTGDLPRLLPLLPLVLSAVWLFRKPLTALTLSETECRALGVNVPLCRSVLLLCGTALTAASVSVSGVIGWVGLMVPHMARMLIGREEQGRVTLVSALLGWIFLLAVDNVARLMMAREIPLGILTSLMGAPFYFWLLLRRGRWNHD